MSTLWVIVTGVLLACAHQSCGCYQECSSIFSQKIQQLVGVRDTALLTQRSCQAMSEQMSCLEGKKATCDATSLQYVTTILNFIRPDYERTCTGTPTNTTDVQTSAQQVLMQCSQKSNQCYVTFNATYAPAVLLGLQNITAICQSLDNYTSCLEELMPECGPYIGRAINSIRVMQQQYAYVCSAGQSAKTMRECVNGTMDCYSAFNTSFLPAVNQYNMALMCSAMDNYSLCLNSIHQRPDCQRFTQQALIGLNTLKRQYAMYCAGDGGQQAQKCVRDFQLCYGQFNRTYFPDMHRGNMKGICSSVQRYWDCVQPLYRECGQQMSQALASVRVLKEQFSAQCDPEFQKLASCRPLMSCLNHFATAYRPQISSSSFTSLCTSLSSYFPCVERSRAECKIPPKENHVDFSQLGTLTGAYCQNLLSHRVLVSCTEFLRCTSSTLLVAKSDPTAMFDAATWCSYMEMALSCVERAVHTPSCGLTNDDTLKGQLAQQQATKRSVCKVPPPPVPVTTEPVNTEAPNVVPVDTSDKHQKGSSSTQTEDKKPEQPGGSSDSSALTSGVASLVLTAVVCLLSQLFRL